MSQRTNLIAWWFWTLLAALLVLGLAWRPEALVAALAVAVLQVVYFLCREAYLVAFPVQVRLAYAAMVAAGLALSHALLWLVAAGTLARVLFGYCFLARALSLLPLNRATPLSWQAVRRAFLSPPVRGSLRETPFTS